jgi:hypothetical protein
VIFQSASTVKTPSAMLSRMISVWFSGEKAMRSPF